MLVLCTIINVYGTSILLLLSMPMGQESLQKIQNTPQQSHKNPPAQPQNKINKDCLQILNDFISYKVI